MGSVRSIRNVDQGVLETIGIFQKSGLNMTCPLEIDRTSQKHHQSYLLLEVHLEVF